MPVMPVITEDREIRAFTLTELRVDAGADGKPTIFGYAAVFDQLSQVMWGFQEKIARGAFSKALTEDDVRALFNHDPNIVLGRNIAKTLRMWEDIHGLRFEIDPPDTQAGRDLVESIRRGDIDQMSFAFRAIKEAWEELEKANEAGAWFIRTLLEVKLYDVSVVTYAAYPQTSAGVREEVQQMQEKRNAALEQAGACPSTAEAQVRQQLRRLRQVLYETAFGKSNQNGDAK